VAHNYIGHYYPAWGKAKHCIVLRPYTISSSEVQRLMVERRSNVLVPRETTGKAVEQYQPITIEKVPIGAVEWYRWYTADMDGMQAFLSECMSKVVNVQQWIPQLVDAYISMISKQNAFNGQMTNGVGNLCHTVRAYHTEIFLQSQVFPHNIAWGITVNAAKPSHDYEIPKDAFNAQIPAIIVHGPESL
jgi:hypothetical protein